MDKMTWKEINLGDAATFVNGYAFKPSQWEQDGLEIIRIANLTGSNSKFNYFKGELKDKYLVTKGDLLISWSATLGIFEWEREDGWLNQHIFKVIFDKENFDKSFFKHLINSVLHRLEREVHGATMKHITKKKFDAFKIPLPPLATQKRIAEILDNAAALKEKTELLLKEYDSLAQSIFLDMFGDPVVNPKSWKKVTFNKLFEQGRKSIKPENIKKGDKYLGLEHIEKETGEILEVVELNVNELKSNKFWFNQDYALYGKLRPYLNKVASPNFEGICSTDIIPFKPISGKSNKAFLVSILRGNWFVNYANERTSGANLPRVSPSEVNKFSTINPPIELQNQFAEKISLIEQQKALAKQELAESEALFACLLQKAFKGALVK